MTSQTADTAADERSRALERCCAVLEAEIERQEHVLDICREQGRAARARDIDALESATRDLARAVNSVMHAEAERIAVIADSARGLGIVPHDLRLSRLVRLAPQPFRSRLIGIQRRLRTVVSVTRHVVEANGRLFFESVRTADSLMAQLLGEAPRPDTYSRDGRNPNAPPRANALLNLAG